MAIASYTPRQIEALAWLPADGSNRSRPDEETRLSLLSLWAKSPETIGWFSPLYHPDYFRLTPSGIAERARLVEIGAIK